MNKRYKGYFNKITAYFMAVMLIILICAANVGYIPHAEESDEIGVNGEDVVALAESYVGKVPYVSGGNSLETGTDCSGFVILIYKQFGINIPGRSSQGIFDRASEFGTYIGTDLSQALPGDIIFTASSAHGVISHVGIIKNSTEMVHQTVPGSSVKVQQIKYIGSVRGIVRPFALSNSSDGGVKVDENSHSKVVLSASDENIDASNVEYKWTIKGPYEFETDWSSDFATYTFYLPKTGAYKASLYIRNAGDESGELVGEHYANFYHQNAIKGICQMPYDGEGGGYLIGIESYENPNQCYTYEMLILDCTLYAQNLPAWIYTTTPCGVGEGNALWTVWQPQYGYYWTLFRVYDENGNMIGEECFGFQNIV